MMEEKNLLKEITYLSKLIGQHKSRLKSSALVPECPIQKAGTKLQPASRLSSASEVLAGNAQTGRQVVVRKSSLTVRVVNNKPVAHAPTATAPPVAAHSVHINPNFLAKANAGKESAVYVNPNFFKKAENAEADVGTLMCKSVHINPRLLSSTQNARDGRTLLLRNALQKIDTHMPPQGIPPVTSALSGRVVPQRAAHVTLADVSKKTQKCIVQGASREKSSIKMSAEDKKAVIAIPKGLPIANEIKKSTIDTRKIDVTIQKHTGAKKIPAVSDKKMVTGDGRIVTLVGDVKMMTGDENKVTAAIDDLSSPFSKKGATMGDKKKSVSSEKTSAAVGKRADEKISTVEIDKKVVAAVEKNAVSLGEKKTASTECLATTAAKRLAPVAETKQTRPLSKAVPSTAAWGPTATPARRSTAVAAAVLATPLRTPTARRRYSFRSKTKLVRAVRTPHGSTLLALSRTKLVRLPGRTRRQSGLGGCAASSASLATAAATATATPPSRASGPRALRTPAGSTLLAISRTKLVRLPGRTRRLSTPKLEAPPTSSTPMSSTVSASSLSTSSLSSSTVTKTRYRLRRSSSSAAVQSPVVRLAKKVCSKYRYRSITIPAVTSTFRLDRRTGKPTPRRASRLAWSAAGSGNLYKVDHRAGTGTSVVTSATSTASKVRGHLLFSPLRRPGLSAFGNRVWARTTTSTPKVALSHKRLSRIGSNPGSRNYRQNSALVRIGGLLYKSSRNKLILSKTPDKAIVVNIKPRTVVKRRLNVGGQVVYVRGDKFIMDSSGKTMQRASCDSTSNVSSALHKRRRCLSRIDIGGVTFIQKSPNVLVRTNTHKARNVLSTAKQKSIAFLAQKMRKINTPCLFYRRFGRCPRREKGRCELVHDPKYIDICRKFLQGKCSVDGCLLSHNVGPEKMPTCRFFLEACCVRDNCPYLHVKVNDRAPICRNFLQGYCAEGPECLKRHISLCPEFDEKGSCSKGKYCPYPHSTAPHRHHRATCSGPPITCLKPEEDGSDLTAEIPSLPKRKRYYEDLTPEESCHEPHSCEDSNEEDDVSKSNVEPHIMDFPTRKRAKIGDLPSFISLE